MRSGGGAGITATSGVAEHGRVGKRGMGWEKGGILGVLFGLVLLRGLGIELCDPGGTMKTKPFINQPLWSETRNNRCIPHSLHQEHSGMCLFTEHRFLHA